MAGLAILVRVQLRIMMRILLVEDDPVLGTAVRDQIVADGHSVDWMKRLDEAAGAIHAAAYDLILLDLMLPDGRGLDFLKARRAAGDVTPVVILTARDQISDRIAGLNAGADDYLVKPFDLFELSARIRAVVFGRWCRRRTSGASRCVVRCHAHWAARTRARSRPTRSSAWSG
jgi:DNA-binding response OmpR family regulator